MSTEIHQGDAVEVMAGMAAESVDAIVTDPPYMIGVLGNEWDRMASRDFQAWCEAWAAEALRAAAGEAARAWPPLRPAEAGAKPGAQAGRPPLVLIESPHAGDVARNERYARACLADSLARGEAPFASHLLYTQPGVLDDADPAERRQGIEAGLAWGARATLTAVYDDLGITEGMRQGIERAKGEGRPIVFRRLAGWDDPEPARPTACESCGTRYADCTDRIMRGSAACCRACYSTDRHAAIPWEQWQRRQRTPGGAHGPKTKAAAYNAWADRVDPHGVNLPRRSE